tara:strand:- start:2025 stop:2381 length:357 start_codon:yes stop_codon:yes gene_type:complete
MPKTRLKDGLRFKVVKPVLIKDNCWNEPSVGTLEEGTVVEVTGGPSEISDVPFKVIEGGGTINRRKRDWRGWPTEELQGITPQKNYDGFFFSQGHETECPYDYGTLCSTFYKLILEEK